MVKNYGYTVSFNQRKLKDRIRGGSVFRTKSEAERYVKELKGNAKAFGISNVRSVKASKKEYDRHVKQVQRDIINSKPMKKRYAQEKRR